MTWLKAASILFTASLAALASGFAVAAFSQLAAVVLFWVTAGITVSGMVCVAVSYRFTR